MNPDGTGETRYRDWSGDVRIGKVIRYRAGRVHLWAERIQDVWCFQRVLPVERLLVDGRAEDIVAGALDNLPRDVVESALG